MKDGRRRMLRNGHEVDVGRNKGLRKLCRCARRNWAKCSHAWYFNFAWQGKGYRFSLDRHVGRHIDSKSEAEALADSIRVAIRGGQFQRAPSPAVDPPVPSEPPALSFDQLGKRWLARERVGKVPTADDDGYRLKRLADIVDAEGNPLGRKAAGLVTEDDLEHAIDVLRQRGHAASTINHYVQTLKSLERWGVRKGHLPKRWLSEDTSLRLRKSAQRSRRLVPDVLDAKGNVKVAGEERRLLSAANPWLQRLIIAALETGCRRGELLALQWADVNLEKGELTVRAETTKTKSRRLLPVSPRLRAVLGMIRTRPRRQRVAAWRVRVRQRGGRAGGRPEDRLADLRAPGPRTRAVVPAGRRQLPRRCEQSEVPRDRPPLPRPASRSRLPPRGGRLAPASRPGDARPHQRQDHQHVPQHHRHRARGVDASVRHVASSCKRACRRAPA